VRQAWQVGHGGEPCPFDRRLAQVVEAVQTILNFERGEQGRHANVQLERTPSQIWNLQLHVYLFHPFRIIFTLLVVLLTLTESFLDYLEHSMKLKP